MSFRFPSEHLADLQYDAQCSIERGAAQEIQLDALVAATEADSMGSREPPRMRDKVCFDGA